MTKEKQTQKQVERENPEEIKLKWIREDCIIDLDGRYSPVNGIIIDEQSKRGLFYKMHFYGRRSPLMGGYSSKLIGYGIFMGTSDFGNPYYTIELFRSEILKSRVERRDVSVEESDIMVPRETFEGIFKSGDESTARSLIDICYETKSFQDFKRFKRTFPHDSF